MGGNDIVGIRQMSLLVVIHLLSRCRPSGHQGKKRKLWCFRLLSTGRKMEMMVFYAIFLHI